MRILAFLYVQIWTVLWACSEPIILYLTFGCYLRRFRLMPWSPRRWARRWTGRLLRTSLARRYLWNPQSWLLRFFITRSKLPLPWFHRNRDIFHVAFFVLTVFFIREFFAFYNLYLSTESKAKPLTWQNRFCFTQIQKISIPIPVIVFTVPEVKLIIFRAINSKDKTAFLTSLPNFALNIFQEFLPRPRYPTDIIRTPLVRFDTSIFGGLAPPWTVFLVSPCSSIIATHSCFLQVHHVVVWTRVDVCAPPWRKSPCYLH